MGSVSDPRRLFRFANRRPWYGRSFTSNDRLHKCCLLPPLFSSVRKIRGWEKGARMFPFCGCLVSDISVFILSPMVRSEIWVGRVCARRAGRPGRAKERRCMRLLPILGRHLPVDFLPWTGDEFSRQGYLLEPSGALGCRWKHRGVYCIRRFPLSCVCVSGSVAGIK